MKPSFWQKIQGNSYSEYMVFRADNNQRRVTRTTTFTHNATKGDCMSVKKSKHIHNLFSRELPKADSVQARLATELAPQKLTIYLDEGTLGGQLYRILFKRIREIAHTTVNETIMYWLENAVGGGIDYPELGVEFPYLQGNDTIDPFIVWYFVRSENGTRAEIKRVELREALMLSFGLHRLEAPLPSRVKSVATQLRVLAESLERA
jgi:hypothetical protein